MAWNSSRKSKWGSSKKKKGDVEGVTKDVADSLDDNNPILPWITGAIGMVVQSAAKDCARSTKELVDYAWSDDHGE